MLQKLRGKLRSQLIAWPVLGLVAPAVLSVSVFGLAVSVQPMPAPAQIHSQTAAHTKKVIHQPTASPKAVPPVAVAPPPTAPPSVPPPAPVKKTVAQAGTTKPEPVVTPSPNSSVSGLTPTAPTPAPASSQTTTGYLSTNWSGYLATNGTFTGVSGAWNATLASGSGSTTSADSTWIGIGGVTTSDLIQVGTQNIISASGQVSASAFYELLPNVSQPVPGVTVAPGDSLAASISQVSSGQWSISITDRTNGQSATFTVSYASSLSSAEWIEEDPSYSSRRQIPFDNFHQAVFTAGLTVENGRPVNLAASSAQPVTMVNSSGQPVAIPSAIGGDGASFSVSP